VSVAFFAVSLLVLVIGLEAWFNNYENAERAAKTVKQGAPGTPLGEMLANDYSELYPPDGAALNTRFPKEMHVVRIPVDRAMEIVTKQYEAEQGKQE